MSFLNPYDSPNYYVIFRDLLSIREDYHIETLIQEELQKEEQAPAPLLHPLNPLRFIRIEHDTSLLAEKKKTRMTALFQQKISGWANTLTKHLFNVMYEPDLLKILKNVFSKVVLEQKITLLERKLKVGGFFDAHIKEAIERLSQMAANTLRIVPLERLRLPANNPQLIRRTENASSPLLQRPLKGRELFPLYRHG